MLALAQSPSPESAPLTQLLRAWNRGESEAAAALMGAVYGQLRAIAQRQLRGERREHTLQATAVVHEAYARLVGADTVDWQDRRHFFAVAASTMRRILVDHARARLAVKRGGDTPRSSLDAAEGQGGAALCSGRAAELVAIDEALTRLQSIDADKAQLVQLRFFAGFSLEETAQLLGCSRGTVVRKWRVARAWLYRELGGQAGR